MDEKIIKLQEEFKQKIDVLNDYLFASGLPDPITRIQQISLLFFLKMIEERDNAFIQDAKLTKNDYKSIFAGEKNKYRWSEFVYKGGKKLLEFIRDDVFEFVRNLSGHDNVREIFYDSRLKIDDPATLKRTLEIIDAINFSDLDADVKGDLYEDMLNQIEHARALGAFRTPRHIIRSIVQLADPKIGETVFDPACGTGGFLVIGYEYIRTKNSSKELVKPHNGSFRGPGDKLSRKRWQFLQNETFFGQDVDPEMVRLTLMNFFLHGLEESDIKRKDTVAGSENEEDLKRYDVVMTNPPFAGKVDRERIKKSLPIKSTKTQILFLNYVIDALKPNGRGGIILPEGTLFGTNRDDKEIRRYLLEKCQLQAVISMPAGVFQPYAGVKTSVFIFKKKPIPKLDENEKIWFFIINGDGSSLSKAKKFGPQYKNDIPLLLKAWSVLHILGEGGLPKEAKKLCWFTPVKDIIENDYILSANTYNPYTGEEEVNHRAPKEILKEIEMCNKDISKTFIDIKKFLE